MAKKPKFYVVWQGRHTGVFSDWASCQAQIKGFAGAKFKSFNSLSEAQTAFTEGADKHIGVKKIQTQPHQQKNMFNKIIVPSWAVDAACEGNPGKMEYRIVNTENSTTIYHSPIFPRGTNNIGEFLALVTALKQRDNANIKAIYTDSRTALAWVRKGSANSNLTLTKESSTLLQEVTRAEEWLQSQNIPKLLSYVHKWETREWGEIPADFGRK